MLIASPVALATDVPYAKLVTASPSGGCAVPLQPNFLETLAKVTQLPNGVATEKMVNVYGKQMLVASSTPEANVIKKCTDTNLSSLGSYSLDYGLFQLLWLSLDGKIAYDDLTVMPPSVPNEEFVLTAQPGSEIEISEPLIFGDPKASFKYTWNMGYVLSVTTTPASSWVGELNNQLHETQIGGIGKGLVPISGTLPTIKAAANFTGECGIILQQNMTYFSGVRLVGFPKGICIKANNVIVDRVKIENGIIGVDVMPSAKRGAVIRSQIQNEVTGVSVAGTEFRVIGNIITDSSSAAVNILNGASATVRDNVTGSKIITFSTQPESLINTITTEEAGDFWNVTATIALPKSSNIYLTGDLYAYTPSGGKEQVHLISRRGCFRWGATLEKLSNIEPTYYKDPLPGVCSTTDNYGTRIVWQIPKTMLKKDDQVIVVITEGAQPFMKNAASFISILSAPFGGNDFGFANTTDPKSTVVGHDFKIRETYKYNITPGEFKRETYPKPNNPWWWRWRR